MTAAIVSSVVTKLDDVLLQEALFFHEVTSQIELVKLQLGQMQCFLKDAASKQKNDERVKGWVKDIRDLAYETEDAIDTFLDVMARGRSNDFGAFTKLIRKSHELYSRGRLNGVGVFKKLIRKPLDLCAKGRLNGVRVFKKLIQKPHESYARGRLNGLGVFKKLIQKPLGLYVRGRLNGVGILKKLSRKPLELYTRGRLNGVDVFKTLSRKSLELYARRALGKRILIIQAKLRLISEGRETFGINNLREDGGGALPRSVLRAPLNPDNDSYDIVGFEDDKRSIINQLVNNVTTQRRRVVSIVGQGGLGKTTLAQKVYNSNEIRGYFKVCIWLTISSDFKPIDLSKNVLEKLRNTRKDELDNNEEYFLREMSKSLNEKRYLIVLDDVWAYDNSFAQFLRALPDVGNGSQVLITSRFIAIERRSDPASEPYELRFLSEKESLELLLSNALPHQNTTSSCPDNLKDVANQLAKKCGGLPLALVVLGGLLSIKNPTYNNWYRVLKTMDWQYDCSECMQILAMSYEDLPYSLKPCFLYLACFPEDFEIGASKLTNMWIAEGFIIPKGRKTLEDVADSCLQELVQR